MLTEVPGYGSVRWPIWRVQRSSLLVLGEYMGGGPFREPEKHKGGREGPGKGYGKVEQESGEGPSCIRDGCV